MAKLYHSISEVAELLGLKQYVLRYWETEFPMLVPKKSQKGQRLYRKKEMEVLFTLLSDRYEHGSIMLTSNLPFSKWEQIFKDPMTTAAAIDRLVHHSMIIELNLTSYRMETAKKNR